MKKFLLSFFALTCFACMAWAGEVTLENATTTNGLWDNGTATVTQEKWGGTTNPANYNSAPRIYQYHALVLDAGEGNTWESFNYKVSGTYYGNGLTWGSSDNPITSSNYSSTTPGEGTAVTSSNGTTTLTFKGGRYAYIYNGGSTNTQLRLTAFTATYKSAKAPANAHFEKSVYTVTFGDAFVAPTVITDSNGAVTYSSSNTECATVGQNGAVTINAVGETTITATVAATDSYEFGEASYKLEVISAGWGLVTFDGSTLKGSTSSNNSQDEIALQGISIRCDNAAFAPLSNNNPVSEYRFYQGSTTTITSNQTIKRVEFIASTDKLPSNFSVPEGKPGDYDTSTYTWTGSSNVVTLYASAQCRAASVKVYFDKSSEYELTDNSVYLYDEAFTGDVTYERAISNTDNWQAICLPFDLPASDWETEFSKVVAFDNAEVNGSEVTLSFTEIPTGTTLTAGTPYLFKTDNASIAIILEQADCVKAADVVSVTKAGYALNGNFNEVTDMTAAYGLASDGNFHKGSATAVLKPFRAYITTGSAKAPAKLKVNIDGQEVDGLDNVIFFEGENGATYNLKGIKVENPANGIVIRNGKKVFVK